MPSTTARRRWERLLAAALSAELAVAAVAVIRQHEGSGPACAVRASSRQRGLGAAVGRACEAAVPRVTAVWGSDWSRRVVVVLPAGLRELEQQVPAAGDLEQVAAVVSGNRVYVNPVAFARLSPAGQGVVLAHEITHLASRATDGGVPLWLAEGLADYVGFLHAGIPLDRAAAELRTEVRAGRLPLALPTDAAFDGPDLPATYQQSWLAVSRLVRLRGQAAVVAFYRAVRAGTAVDVALPRLLGLTTAQLVLGWRADLRQLAR